MLETALMLCQHCSAVTRILLCYQLLSNYYYKAQHCEGGAVGKNNSISARPNTNMYASTRALFIQYCSIFKCYAKKEELILWKKNNSKQQIFLTCCVYDEYKIVTLLSLLLFKLQILAAVLKNRCAFCFQEQGGAILLSQYLSFIYLHI